MLAAHAGQNFRPTGVASIAAVCSADSHSTDVPAFAWRSAASSGLPLATSHATDSSSALATGQSRNGSELVPCQPRISGAGNVSGASLLCQPPSPGVEPPIERDCRSAGRYLNHAGARPERERAPAQPVSWLSGAPHLHAVASSDENALLGITRHRMTRARQWRETVFAADACLSFRRRKGAVLPLAGVPAGHFRDGLSSSVAG